MSNLGEGYVEIRPDVSKFESELLAAIRRAMAGVSSEITKATGKIGESFSDAAAKADKALTGIDGDGFRQLKGLADKAGNEVVGEFSDAAREADKALTSVDGDGFQMARTQADAAGAVVTREFQEASTAADAKLAGVDGDGFQTLKQEARRAGDQVGDSLEGGADRATKAFQAFGRGIATLGISSKIISLAKTSIQAFSDMGESISKANVVFGQGSRKIFEYADDAAQSLGQSRQQAIDAASGFAIFGTAAGLTGKELSDFAMNLTSLASDLSSFSNTRPEEAVLSLTSALRGEYESIRRYGVLLNETTLQQKALEMGIYSGSGALNMQQRVLAANVAIFEQTKLAQGDFERTSTSLANQQKILAAEFKNMQLTIGEALAPAWRTIISIGGDLLAAFGALPEPIQKTIAVAVTGAAVFATAATSLKMLGVAASTANIAIAAIGAVAITVGTAYTLFKAKAAEAEERQQALNDALVEANAPTNQLKTSFDALVKAYEELERPALDAEDALAGLEGATKFVGAEMLDYTPLIARFGATLDDVTSAVQGGTDDFENLAEAIQKQIPNLAVSTDQYGAYANIIDRVVSSSNPLNQMLKDLAASGELNGTAFNKLLLTLDDTADAFDDNANKTNSYWKETLKGADAVQLYGDILGEEVYAELVKNADATAEAAGRTDEWTYLQEQLIAQLEELGVTIDPVTMEVEGLGQRFTDTTQTADGFERSLRNVEQSQTDQAAATQAANEAIQKQLELMTEMANAALAAFNSEIQAEQAKRATTQSIAEYNTVLEEMKNGTLKGEEGLIALAEAEEQVYLDALAAAEATAQLASDQMEMRGGALSAEDALRIQRDELQRVANTLAPGSPLRAQLEQYIRILNDKIPRDIRTQWEIRQTFYMTRYERTVVTSSGMGSGRNPPPTANGGIFASPQVRLIGEAGAEAVIPITRPSRAMQLMNQSGLTDMIMQNMNGSNRKATVNIENAVFANGTDANLVAQKVSAAERSRSFAS